MSDELHVSVFERIRQTTESGGEYWSARDLAEILDYASWQRFINVIERAMQACENSGYGVSDHFVLTVKMVALGSGAQRQIRDFHLSRYGCYLVVQNADPSKEIVALGQTYFAVQTRRQEMADELAGLTGAQRRLYLRGEVALHNHQITEALAATIPETITARDYAAFHDHGYRGLYNGETARDIAARKGLKRGQHILDYMGTEELADNLFRQVQAEARLQREGVTNKHEANRVHHEVGTQVRRFIIEDLGGTPPEQLPTPAESIQELQQKERARIGRERQPSLFDTPRAGDEGDDGLP
jgi:DNA-damage-inducible protein D